MSLVRIASLSLLLSACGFTGSVLANQVVETHRLAVTLVAMEHLCNKANPGLNGSVENAMASDPSIDEPTKAEVRKISSDPAYKGEVEFMMQSLNNSGLATMAQDLCKSYAAK
ncbi:MULTISPECIES: hypothetical protein [Pseudomonas]|uniref:Lipoprotein n=1 Tax=Pseudomonas viciae TaxID=2505979 RepID=A0ABY8P8X7_9PSED|nr:hypothetical protein [Pseudomonas viciae]WGO91667.1 hypothetical protein QCD61_18305 [Pseudomonas viciae]